jgi:hypothetical protein
LYNRFYTLEGDEEAEDTGNKLQQLQDNIREYKREFGMKSIYTMSLGGKRGNVLAKVRAQAHVELLEAYVGQ